MKWLNRVKDWGKRIEAVEAKIALPSGSDIDDIKKELKQLQADISLWQRAITKVYEIDKAQILQDVKDCREDASLAIHDCSKLGYRMDELEINVTQMITAIKVLKK